MTAERRDPGVGSDVSRPDARSRTQIPLSPARLETNASVEPSDESDGHRSTAVVRVRSSGRSASALAPATRTDPIDERTVWCVMKKRPAAVRAAPEITAVDWYNTSAGPRPAVPSIATRYNAPLVVKKRCGPAQATILLG